MAHSKIEIGAWFEHSETVLDAARFGSGCWMRPRPSEGRATGPPLRRGPGPPQQVLARAKPRSPSRRAAGHKAAAPTRTGPTTASLLVEKAAGRRIGGRTGL